jgi:hypothetical protein
MTATEQLDEVAHRPADHPDGDRTGKDAGHRRNQGDAWVVADGARQTEGKNADEVHGPDATAHGQGADTQPGDAHASTRRLADLLGDIERGQRGENGDQDGNRHPKRVIVADIQQARFRRLWQELQRV